ncbi:hypothetical protein ACX80J_01980 [Arthrobacter sp. MDB2-24]
MQCFPPAHRRIPILGTGAPDEKGQEYIQGLEAYEHALEDNYFQLVILDDSTGIGRQLAPEEFGFAQTNTVTDPASGHTWRIYQRFDEIRP